MGIMTTKKDKPIPVYREGYGLETGASGSSVYSLVAHSHPDGARIDLAWTNPVGATHIKILRCQQAFAWDLTDTGTMVYNGTVVTAYSDTGLGQQMYYYYLVAVSTDGGTTYNIELSSRVFQLSISTTLNSKDFFWDLVPLDYKSEDANQGNVLKKLVDVMGAGLNLIRSRSLAITLLNDPDNSPLHMVLFQAASVGFAPEVAFDFNTSRRAFGSIIGARKDKGDMTGLTEFIRIFTGWNASIVEFGAGAYGSRVFQTYAGPANLNELNSGGTISYTNGTLTDSSKTWSVDQWSNGLLTDAVGNNIPILSSTSNKLTLDTAVVRGTLGADIFSGVTVIPLTSNNNGWSKGMTVQITDPNGITTENTTVEAVGALSLTISSPLVNGYTLGAKLYRVPTFPMMEYKGTGVAAALTMQDTNALWGDNQWAGYKYLDSANVLRTVVSNTVDTLTLDGAVTTGAYVLAYGYTVGASFVLRVVTNWYSVTNGTHSFLYEPRKKFALRGTIDDPFDYLYGGSGTLISPSYALGDVGIFISNVAVEYGKSTAISTGAGILLTAPELAGYPNNYFVGMWLNPNRNQTQMFRIAASFGSGSVLTDGPVNTGYAVTGNDYFILTARDAIRYSRLVLRAPEEAPDSARLFFFFE